jgi:hypothetical protein
VAQGVGGAGPRRRRLWRVRASALCGGGGGSGPRLCGGAGPRLGRVRCAAALAQGWRVRCAAAALASAGECAVQCVCGRGAARGNAR